MNKNYSKNYYNENNDNIDDDNDDGDDNIEDNYDNYDNNDIECNIDNNYDNDEYQMPEIIFKSNVPLHFINVHIVKIQETLLF